ncbi:MAG: hypothetical protein ACRDLY_12315 [Thermoleophilaceae bacterium]
MEPTKRVRLEPLTPIAPAGSGQVSIQVEKEKWDSHLPSHLRVYWEDEEGEHTRPVPVEVPSYVDGGS